MICWSHFQFDKNRVPKEGTQNASCNSRDKEIGSLSIRTDELCKVKKLERLTTR